MTIADLGQSLTALFFAMVAGCSSFLKASVWCHKAIQLDG